jgi:hypothetical protein
MATRLALSKALGHPSQGYLKESAKDLLMMLSIPAGKAVFGKLFALGAKQFPKVQALLKNLTEEEAQRVFERPLAKLAEGEKIFLALNRAGRAAFKAGEIGTEAHVFMVLQAIEPAIKLAEENPKKLNYVEDLLVNLKTILELKAGNAAGEKVGEKAGQTVRAIKKSLQERSAQKERSLWDLQIMDRLYRGRQGDHRGRLDLFNYGEPLPPMRSPFSDGPLGAANNLWEPGYKDPIRHLKKVLISVGEIMPNLPPHFKAGYRYHKTGGELEDSKVLKIVEDLKLGRYKDKRATNSKFRFDVTSWLFTGEKAAAYQKILGKVIA